MFSGPDYLYANAFFPKASTYVLSGLERTGPIPDITKLRGAALGAGLGHLKRAAPGAQPQLLHHLANGLASLPRAAQRHAAAALCVPRPLRQDLRDVSYVQLEPDGTVKPYDASAPRGMPRAVKIVFASGSAGPEQTLYYFSTNLANDGVAKSGFLKFCETLGTGDSFVKSASYLLHGGGFSSVREFMLNRSTHILQDDTGIPVSHFKDDAWSLQPLRPLLGPIPACLQPLSAPARRLFTSANRAKPLDFGVGYSWRPGPVQPAAGHPAAAQGQNSGPHALRSTVPYPESCHCLIASKG